MAEMVAILEDSLSRIVQMRACLAEILPGMESVFFDNAQQMIGWLGQHLGEVVLISLDHDLPLRNLAGEAGECGTGREVADYLAGLAPTCPVMVHSSNHNCAAGMVFALKDAGWPVSRVYPVGEQSWIRDAWAKRVREYVEGGRIGSGGHGE